MRGQRPCGERPAGLSARQQLPPDGGILPKTGTVRRAGPRQLAPRPGLLRLARPSDRTDHHARRDSLSAHNPARLSAHRRHLRSAAPDHRLPRWVRLDRGGVVPGRRSGRRRPRLHLPHLRRARPGCLIREQGLPFRPDWEHVLTPVLDWALRRPEVDADAVALMGMSLGGYLAPRAAAFEPRLAALVAYDGMYDFYDTVRGRLPAPVLHLVEQGPDAPARAAVRALGAMNATARWSLGNGAWTFGVAGALEFLRAMPAYTLAGGVAERISCPTLVLAAQRDHLAPGQAELLRQHLTAPASLVRFTADEGAGEHCQEGAMAVLPQRGFDRLDETPEH